MKWKSRTLYVGKSRKRKKFLLFPKQINGEWHWLETATWEEEYRRRDWYSNNNYWIPMKWCS